MSSPYPLTSGPSFALHAPDWHPSCDVEFQMVGGRPMLWCRACRCLASLEAVADKVRPEATYTPPPAAVTEATP
jgi:hypothetical protein